MGKIYFDLAELSAEIQKLFKQTTVETATKTDFKDYCLFLMQNYEDGVIGPKLLAHQTAGVMPYAKRLGPKTEEIVILAGELELPDAHISGDSQKRFDELVSMIRGL